MRTVLDSPSRWGLLANMAVFVGVALVWDAVVFAWRWGELSGSGPPFAPPGSVIGGIWLVLFGFMAAIRWWLNRLETQLSQRQRTLLVFLFLLCLAYPLYTVGLAGVAFGWLAGLVGNLATLGFTLFVTLQVRRSAPKLAWLLLPMMAWLVFATLMMLADMHLGG